MHAWEAIQKTLNYIEEHIGEDFRIEELAEIAALSLFYYQRLFARLVKKPVREYIKLRRLARASETLRDKDKRILDIAVEYGFGCRETFTRTFKEAYGIAPQHFRDEPVELMHFVKPDLLLNYTMVDEGVPLISEGMVLEYNRMFLEEPINFLGVTGPCSFTKGKMLGEKTGIDEAGAVWETFNGVQKELPGISGGRMLGLSYPGNAPPGYFTYFAGAEVEPGMSDSRFVSWQLPAREYVVCNFAVEHRDQLSASLGKMMKFTRYWLKKHGLTTDGFFPEMYYGDSSATAYMEMWIPFRQRDEVKKIQTNV